MERKTWKEHYANAGCYGAETTYQKAGEWLSGMAVEDWGCGYCFARKYMQSYIGIDVGCPLADKNVDLKEYHSSIDGILIRHVLEHDYNWRMIIKNAVESFKKRLCVIFFIPPNNVEDLLHSDEATIDCPVLSICKPDFEDILTTGGCTFTSDLLQTGSCPYGLEMIYYVEKQSHSCNTM